MSQPSVTVDLLPLLQDFVRLVGLQATMALVGAVGGLRVYIPTPERATPEHPFAVLIGFDSLLKLAAEYGGQPHFQLPKADRCQPGHDQGRFQERRAHDHDGKARGQYAPAGALDPDQRLTPIGSSSEKTR